MLKTISKAAAAAAIIGFAVWMTFISSGADINYCKSVIKNGESIVMLNENAVGASVIKTDKNGGLIGTINLVSDDFFRSELRSFGTLFTDDSGGEYLCCKVYRNGLPCTEEVYKCDFGLGVATKFRSLESAEGYTFSSGCVPTVADGTLYAAMERADGGSTDVVAFYGDGGYEVIRENAVDEKYIAERIICTSGSTAVMTMRSGVFLDGERIYPERSFEGECIINGLSCYDGGFVFMDLMEEKIIICDPSGCITESIDFDGSDSQLMQGITAYPDGSVCASYESGGDLSGIYRDGKLRVQYSEIKGAFLPLEFLKILAALAAAVFAAWLFYTLIFVRKRKKILQKYGSKFVSAVSRITAVSLAVSAIASAASGMVIYSDITRLNSYWSGCESLNSAQYIAGYLNLRAEFDSVYGVPQLDGESYLALQNVIGEYKKNTVDGGDENYCEYTVLFEFGENVYCIYSGEFRGSVPAQYAVSITALDKLRDSMRSLENCSFKDKRTIGMLDYTSAAFPVLFDDGEEGRISVCAVKDVYRERLSAMSAAQTAAAAIAGFAAVLLAAANIVLRIILKRLRMLENAFSSYENSGDASGFAVEGSDEISETGGALSLMAEGIKIYTKDINKGNLKYSRLIPAGILKFMDKSRISEVDIGESAAKKVLLVRLPVNENADINALTEEAFSFAEENGGYVLNFGKLNVDVCFENENDYSKALNAAINLAERGGIFISSGEILAGSAGNEQNAFLIVLSEAFNAFEGLREYCLENKSVIAEKGAAGYLSDYELKPLSGKGKPVLFEVIV